MNYIKILQNAQALSVSVGNVYSEDQLMHTFLDNFRQGGKYSARIPSHQADLRREGKCNDQEYLSISFLQTYYLNLDRSLSFGINSKIVNTVHTKCTFCGDFKHSAEKN